MSDAPQACTATNEELERLERLNALLAHNWRHNPFYRSKWQRAGLAPGEISSREQLQDFPFTTRAELIADQAEHPPLGSNLSCPASDFRRFMRSSGTTRSPMLWADTPRTWEWVMKCSTALHLITGLREDDVALFMSDLAGASGPWVILEGARRLGATCLTCPGRDVSEAWSWLCLMRPNVLVGKPSRLLMLAMAVRAHGFTPAQAGVERVILTGEGSSIGSSTRDELEACWDAPCRDRYGMTEAGSVAAECGARTGAVHLLDDEFIAELINPVSGESIHDGSAGELVLTTLGRVDQPIIRYRTGDRTLLRWDDQCSCGRSGTLLVRGILGRVGDAN